MKTSSEDWYNYPAYFDLAFRDETSLEAKFLQAAFAKYVEHSVSRVLEPACGTGRLIHALAKRGYDMVGFDLNPHMIAYTQKRLQRAKLQADIFQADMTSFSLPTPVDAAYNTFNSFRHLLTEEAALSHLRAVAAALRPGGIYVLGLHLLPPDASEESYERWQAKAGRTELKASLKVIAANRRQRLETLRLIMRVTSATKKVKLQSDFTLRIYNAQQMRSLLQKVPAFTLVDVFDFWYEIEHPLKLTNHLSDVVLILKKLES